MDAQAEKLAEPFLGQARRLAKITTPVIQRYNTFESALHRMGMLDIDHVVRDAFRHVRIDLGILMRGELIKELDPYATRALNGEEIEKPQWPELDAILKKYMKSVNVLKPYLPRYSDSLIQGQILTHKAASIIKSLPMNARRERIRVKLNDLDIAFTKDLTKWRDDVLELIRAGKPFDKGKIKRPFDMRVTYDAKLQKVVRETK